MKKQSETRRLSKKQFNVIDDLFGSNCNESQILKKHKISKYIYRKWLADKNFIDELSFMAESSRRRSKMIIAKNTQIAAANLVDLTRSENEETARKACLDIMAQPKTTNIVDKTPEIAQESISPELAGKLLAALARETQKNT